MLIFFSVSEVYSCFLLELDSVQASRQLYVFYRVSLTPTFGVLSANRKLSIPQKKCFNFPFSRLSLFFEHRWSELTLKTPVIMIFLHRESYINSSTIKHLAIFVLLKPAFRSHLSYVFSVLFIHNPPISEFDLVVSFSPCLPIVVSGLYEPVCLVHELFHTVTNLWR